MKTYGADAEVVIVGCGLSGMVLADRFAREMNKKVLILEKRDHIGGNVYDYRDSATGLLVPKYGAHLFHTNSPRVWEYVTTYADWVRWDHRVVARVNGFYVPMPVNIDTVNTLCGENLLDENEMFQWLDEHQVKYESPPKNSEEVAKSRIGSFLFDTLVNNYTLKQWDKSPRDLAPSVLQRIPYRTNRDPRYFNDRYQALPREGYTAFVGAVLDHPNITVRLNTDYFLVRHEIPATAVVIYTGPIDAYFSDLPKLEYRSIQFDHEVLMDTPFFQPNSVVNYPGNDVPFTRIVEPKHFLNQDSPHTLIIKETSTDVGEPYYPVPTQKNQDQYEVYRGLSEKEIGVHFIGRLANYKYFNMDQAILNALEYFDKYFL